MAQKSLKQSIKEILSQSSINDVWTNLDEVYPGIFVGGDKAAKDTETLKNYGITHILNATYSDGLTTPCMGIGVPTNLHFYRLKGFQCEFLGVPALDFPGFDLSVYFHQASEFIDTALKSQGKVLVHCYMGVSRSATLAIAYLMIKQNMTLLDAVKQVRSKRCVIFPNEGFLDQLCELEKQLSRAKCIM